jgi:hypothetical protein
LSDGSERKVMTHEYTDFHAMVGSPAIYCSHMSSLRKFFLSDHERRNLTIVVMICQKTDIKLRRDI